MTVPVSFDHVGASFHISGRLFFLFLIHSTVLGKCCKHMLYISYYAPVTMTLFFKGRPSTVHNG